jgi:mannose-6-phosphate isomerase-like protein (cupin superfamily)
MPQRIASPTTIAAAGTKPKTILEYVGRVNTDTETLSIAQMVSPSGWVEPGQRPEFDEFTVVLAGTLHIDTEDGETMELSAGEAVITRKGEWVRYSTPGAEGAQYVAVCLPAFSPDLVHRDPE